MQDTSEAILNQLRAANGIIVVAHKQPDGDAVGSVLAMYIALVHSLGLSNVKPVLHSEVPAMFSSLPYFFKIEDGFHPLEADTVVILDCGNWKRTGFFEENELNIDWPRQMIVIDHHAIQDLVPGLHLVETNTSSTCELLFQLFTDWKIDISPQLADVLLTGIAFDTGMFRHQNTSKTTLETVAALMQSGGNLYGLLNKSAGGYRANQLKMWGRVLSRLKVLPESKMVISIATASDLEELAVTKDELNGLVNLLNTIPEAELALLLTDTGKGIVKGSLRTESETLDVAKVASWLNGGGHTKAAGFELPGRLQTDGENWKLI